MILLTIIFYLFQGNVNGMTTLDCMSDKVCDRDMDCGITTLNVMGVCLNQACYCEWPLPDMDGYFSKKSR